MRWRPLILPFVILVGGFALVAAALIEANHGFDYSLHDLIPWG